MSEFPPDLMSRIWAYGDVGPTLDVFGARGIDSSGSAGGPLPWWVRGRRASGMALRKSGARVLHATDPHRPWTGRVSTVVTVYDLILLRERAMLESLRPDHRYVYRWFLRQIRSADRVIAISMSTADDVETRLRVTRDRIDIVYPAITAPTGFQRREPAEPTFLVVGALDLHKQPELALKAFADYRNCSGAGRLRFIGPGDPRQQQRMMELASQLGVSGDVSLEGRISDDDLESAYGSATAVVSTSRLEGFGLPPVEAILRGVPVIAVDTPAARETLGVAATIVPPDVSAIAAAMNQPMDPPVAAIAEIRERHSVKTVARALEASYRRLID